MHPHVLDVDDLDVGELPSGTASIVRVEHPRLGEVRLATLDEKGRLRSLDDRRDAFSRKGWKVREVVA